MNGPYGNCQEKDTKHRDRNPVIQSNTKLSSKSLRGYPKPGYNLNIFGGSKEGIVGVTWQGVMNRLLLRRFSEVSDPSMEGHEGKLGTTIFFIYTILFYKKYNYYSKNLI